MVERQHDPIDAHVQNLQEHADLSHGESSRFTFHTLEDNSKAWRFETEIDGRKVALVFPASHLESYINLTREDLRERLRRDMKKPDDPKKPEEKIHFNNYTELEEWLSQHPEEPPFKAVLHFNNDHEFEDWVDQHPEFWEENSKFGIDLEEPVIVRIPLNRPPLTPEEMELGKELFKRVFGFDADDLGSIVEEVPQPKTKPSDQSDVDIQFHLQGGTDSPPGSY